MKKQSKFLALVLRHNPAAGNLTLDAEGWADVDDVLRALKEKYGPFTRDQLQELVDTNDKKRYAFDDTGTRIRANQGHSLKDVDLKLEPQLPPDTLYHGTKRQFVGSIFEEGLKPGSRQHVHLSPDLDTATIVANRRGGANVILVVNAKLMAERSAVQHFFYRSENGVWLTDHVPPAYLTVMEP